MDAGECSKSSAKNIVVEKSNNEMETDNNMDIVQIKGEEQKRLEIILLHKMNMDRVMEKIGYPFRKLKENFYLVAMSTKEEIEKVVAKIQKLTKVTWSVKQTRKFDKTKKPLTLFKRTYGCHMATRCRTKTKKVRNKKSRNIGCPAQLIATVRKYSSHTRSKLRISLLDENFPCAMEFRNHHNHRIDSLDVLNTRPLGEEIKQDVIKLLKKGHSCASAYHTLYTTKVEEFGSDYKTKMSDRHYFPKKNDISSLWKVHNFKHSADLNNDLPYAIKNIEEILSSYGKKSGCLYRIMLKNHSIIVCICTPLMQRTIQQVSEILFIESSADDIKEYKMYFILTQSSVGALPIGCILTNSRNISAFSDGMRLFFQMIQIQPTVVLTNTEIMKELVAEKLFPNSKIMYSFYHILSSAWKLLHETRHEIVRAKKESYYQLFREVVFADNEEALVVARQVLAVECAKQRFLDYVDKMYEHITLWCLLYRQFVVLRGVDTFNYNEAEISFRLFRLISKIPLERTKLFNLTQVIDYMCSAFENYYKNRILEMVLSKESKVLQEKYTRTSDHILHMQDIGHHQYLFKKDTQEILDEYYQVDMITNMCTCAMGVMGKQCEHISEILARCNILTPLLTIEQKAAYYFVATGVLKHKNSFLPDQELDLGKDFRVVCCSPETIFGTEYDSPNSEYATESNRDNTSEPSVANLESTINKWLSYSNKIIKLMEKDPARFLPAVNAHMENIQKYSTSVPALLKGLYAGFPYKGDATKLPPLTIISNKVIPSEKNSQPPHLTRKTLPKSVKIKQETVEPSEENKVAKRCGAATDQNNSVILQIKKELPVEFLQIDSAWNHFNSDSNSALTLNDIECPNENSEENSTVLDERIGILIKKQSKADEEIPKTNNIRTVTRDDLVSDNQMAENGGSVQSEDTSQDGPAIFDLHKEIYVDVDETALNQLADGEIAILDEKKGILFISVPSE